MHFICVFNETDCETLINRGYTLLKFDKLNNMYVFENETKLRFDFSEIAALETDVLTF